jgi:hypothetical protein
VSELDPTETLKLALINFDPRRAIPKTTRAGLIFNPGFFSALATRD